MAKVKEFTCDIYKKEIQIFLGTYDEMLSYAKKEYTNPAYKEFLDSMEDSAPGGAADFHYDRSSCIVRLDMFPETPEEYSYANHELLHATMWIMDSCGVKYKEWSNNEAFTYLHEWLSLKTFEKEGYKEVSDNTDISDTPNETSIQTTEWSEEDERLRQSCISHIEDELEQVRNDKYGHSEIISDLKESCRERIKWLESLHPQNHWNPSEE